MATSNELADQEKQAREAKEASARAERQLREAKDAAKRAEQQQREASGQSTGLF